MLDHQLVEFYLFTYPARMTRGKSVTFTWPLVTVTLTLLPNCLNRVSRHVHWLRIYNGNTSNA